MNSVHESVQEYYGKILQKSEDLKTNACTTFSRAPAHIREAIALIHEEVESKYYGCGLVMPEVLKGMRILDLGCGSGRDCFVLSKLVGESGYVVGVDMTLEQIKTANEYIDYHTMKFGYQKPNVEFRTGYIEALDKLGFQDNSFDIIVSNCVINLSPDKESVLREAFRVLKEGGELYFSDVYSDRRVPKELRENSVLYGECLSGALYWRDFISLAKKAGFADPRLLEDSPITISNKKIEELIGHIKFFSATYRLFKIAELEESSEDYGQAVIYKGGIPDAAKNFSFDKSHSFSVGKVTPLSGNTSLILNSSRFQPYFQFIGDKSIHFGVFSASEFPFGSEEKSAVSEGCCN